MIAQIFATDYLQFSRCTFKPIQESSSEIVFRYIPVKIGDTYKKAIISFRGYSGSKQLITWIRIKV